ncbi:hypothetical protein NDA07_01205 [Microcoleus vaginatus DQ-U2]|uniref:hypothetical protein n=1 Tax=Microcoleus vaginatus TaxID=119532 RepID=UPI001681FFDE|nr:hypothetical protein [Microcoleus sp. FACHB-DQ6]
MLSKIPELNYSVKQKLDRIQPQHEFLGQFFLSPLGIYPEALTRVLDGVRYTLLIN